MPLQLGSQGVPREPLRSCLSDAQRRRDWTLKLPVKVRKVGNPGTRMPLMLRSSGVQQEPLGSFASLTLTGGRGRTRRLPVGARRVGKPG
eukprot:12832812-Alexandrium_andersonii.AAC.1